MAKSHNLNQEKVEEIIGIKPLGYTIDKSSSERDLSENAKVIRKDIDASEHGERKCNIVTTCFRSCNFFDLTNMPFGFCPDCSFFSIDLGLGLALGIQ
jgi:hypothetical protein